MLKARIVGVVFCFVLLEHGLVTMAAGHVGDSSPVTVLGPGVRLRFLASLNLEPRTLWTELSQPAFPNGIRRHRKDYAPYNENWRYGLGSWLGEGYCVLHFDTGQDDYEIEQGLMVTIKEVRIRPVDASWGGNETGLFVLYPTSARGNSVDLILTTPENAELLVECFYATFKKIYDSNGDWSGCSPVDLSIPDIETLKKYFQIDESSLPPTRRIR